MSYKIIILLLLVIILSGCSLSYFDSYETTSSWVRTDNGYIVFTPNNDTTYHWDGESLGKVANGIGNLSLFYNDSLIDVISYSTDPLKFGAVNERDIFKLKNDEYFVGEIENKTFNGFGIYIQNNGNVLVGNFLDHKPEGSLDIYKNNTLVFSGKWKDGKREGVGTIYLNNNETQTFIWENNEILPSRKAIIKTSEYKYEGGYLNNLFHGQGKLISNDSTFYEGNWYAGEKSGQGTYYGDDFAYSGIWKNDSLNGYGTFINDTYEYQGYWNSHHFNGEGSLVINDTIVYEGNFKDNVFHGYGLMLYGNDESYNGDWFNGVRQGIGEYTYTNGATYIGDWKNNYQCGIGEYSDSTHIYAGEFEYGMANGEGTVYYNSTNDNYTGNFINNKKSGYGVYQFLSGNTYEGNFLNDTFEGTGVFEFSDSSRYDGNFRRGNICGKGKLHLTEGKETIVIDGYWEGTNFPEQATILFPNGDEYFGPLKNGMPTSEGLFTTKEDREKLFNGEMSEEEIIKNSNNDFRRFFDKHKDQTTHILSKSSEYLSYIAVGADIVGTASSALAGCSIVAPPVAATFVSVAGSAYAISATTTILSLASASAASAIETIDYGLSLYDRYCNLDEDDKRNFINTIINEYEIGLINSFKQFEELPQKKKLQILGQFALEVGIDAALIIIAKKGPRTKVKVKSTSKKSFLKAKKTSTKGLKKGKSSTSKVKNRKSNTLKKKVNIKKKTTSKKKAAAKKNKNDKRKSPIPLKLSTWATEASKTQHKKFKISRNKYSYSVSVNNRSVGKIYYAKGTGKCIVSTYHYNSSMNVSPLVKKPLLSNTTYKIGASIYTTDRLSRPKKATLAVISKGINNAFSDRNAIKGVKESSIAQDHGRIDLQTIVYGNSKSPDQGGHLIAHSLGGVKGHINIVPQYYKMNNGAYKDVETFVKKHRRHIKAYTVKVNYLPGTIKARPESFYQNFIYYGNKDNLEALRNDLRGKGELSFRVREQDINGKKIYRCSLGTSNKIGELLQEVLASAA